MEPIESPLVMRRSILIAAPPERVWQEFESIERLPGWYAGKTATTEQRVVRYEPGEGGWLEIECEWTHGDTPGSCHLGGPIVVWTPGRELTQEHHSYRPSRMWERPTRLTFRLTPQLGGTVVEILEYGYEVAGEAAADFHLEAELGWTMDELIALRRVVEGPHDLRIPVAARTLASGGR
jgi:uncharacterized protein YndB with AHSA1/START domain